MYTTYQVISIVLSCVIYLHPLTWGQILSAALVFGVLYYKDTAGKSGHSHSHRAPPAEEQRKNSMEQEGEKRIDIKN